MGRAACNFGWDCQNHAKPLYLLIFCGFPGDNPGGDKSKIPVATNRKSRWRQIDNPGGDKSTSPVDDNKNQLIRLWRAKRSFFLVVAICRPDPGGSVVLYRRFTDIGTGIGIGTGRGRGRGMGIGAQVHRCLGV